MRRRSFLQQAGLLVAGTGWTEGAHTAEAAGPDEGRPLVLLAAAGELGQALADRLAAGYRLRSGAEDLRTADVAALAAGCAAVVHLGRAPAGLAGQELIDERTRGTYRLLQAAAAAGVRQVIYISSLAILADYDPRYAVTEDWRPRPAAEAEGLSHYLGEFTCREFTRQGGLRVTVLRLGEVAPARAVEAIAAAVAQGLADPSPLGPWAVFHVAPPGDTHFPSTKAQRILGLP